MDNNEVKVLEMEALKQRADLVTIAGGVHLEVTHLDGTTETVKVRQIPATKIEAFMQKLADESFSVSVYCGKPVSWVDTLSHESFNEVVDKGLEINEPFLSAWCRRRAKWAEMMNVGVIADLQKKLTSLSEALASVSSASRLPIITDSDRET